MNANYKSMSQTRKTTIILKKNHRASRKLSNLPGVTESAHHLPKVAKPGICFPPSFGPLWSISMSAGYSLDAYKASPLPTI